VALDIDLKLPPLQDHSGGPASDCTETPCRPISVLIAERDQNQLGFLAKAKKCSRHEITTVFDGEAALDALERRRFDLVIVSVDLPVIGGIDVYKIFRVIALHEPQIPFVAIAADLTPEIRLRCEQAGIDTCLRGPIKPQMLAGLIARFASKSSQNLLCEATSKSVHGSGMCVTGERPDSDPINLAALRALEDLGGNEFVDSLAAEFCREAPIILREMHARADCDDLRTFNTQLNELRVAACNIGAQCIENTCSALAQISANNVPLKSKPYFATLHIELDRVISFFRERAYRRGLPMDVW